MRSFVRIATIWSDNDVRELQFEVSDGVSIVANTAYVSIGWFAQTAEALERLGRQVHGGLYDLEAGTPGPEFAEGAFEARFQWHTPSELYVSTWQESGFFKFKGREVASTARLFLRTEAALLDRFVAELRAAHVREELEATLTCVPLRGA